jgi:hypothetical protein
MPSLTPEQWREVRAQAMFEFLVRRGAVTPLHHWADMSKGERDAWIDMVALFTEDGQEKPPGR